MPNLRYAAEVLVLLGQQVPNASKVAQLVQSQLKADDNVLNLGYALHLASLLGNSGDFYRNTSSEVFYLGFYCR